MALCEYVEYVVGSLCRLVNGPTDTPLRVIAALSAVGGLPRGSSAHWHESEHADAGNKLRLGACCCS